MGGADDQKYSILPEPLGSLKDTEFKELRDAVDPEGSLTPSMGGGASLPYYSLIVYAKHIEPVVVGALAKSVLDIIVDKVKTWLNNRPKEEAHPPVAIKIYGPRGELLKTVERDKEQ